MFYEVQRCWMPELKPLQYVQNFVKACIEEQGVTEDVTLLLYYSGHSQEGIEDLTFGPR